MSSSPSSSSSPQIALPVLPPISSITDLLDMPLPDAQPLPSPRSRINTLKGLFSSIRDSRARIMHERSKGPKTPSTPALPSELTPPVDITTRLLERGMPFTDARAVSSAFIDNGVQVQFASQQRHAKTQKKALRRARTSKVMENIGHFQEKLRNTQQKIYNSDLRSLFDKTMGMVKSAPTVVDLSDSEEDEEEIVEQPQVVQVADEELDGEVLVETVQDDEASAPATNEEQNVMGEVTPEVTAVLIDVYNHGFTFPDRQEKIKLAQTTNLTYRQIGIWFSNRRDRQRKAEAKAATHNDEESESESGADSDIEIIERPKREESGSLFGTDDEEEVLPRKAPGRMQSAAGSRVPSMTMSMTTASSSSPDHWIDSWLATDEQQAPFVEVAQYVANDEMVTGSMADMFDFTLPTTTATATPKSDSAPAPSSIAFQDLSSLAQSSQPALPVDLSLLPTQPPTTSYPNPPSALPMSDPFSKSSADFLAGFLAGAALNLPHVFDATAPTAIAGPQLAPLALQPQLPTSQAQTQQLPVAGPSDMFNSPPFDVPTSSPVAGYGAKRGISSVEDDDDVVEVADTGDKMDESDDDVVEIPPPALAPRPVQVAPPAKRAKLSHGSGPSRPSTIVSKPATARPVKAAAPRTRATTDPKGKGRPRQKAAARTASQGQGRKKTAIPIAPMAPRRLAPAPIAPRPSSAASSSTSSGSSSPYHHPILPLPLPPYPLQRIRPIQSTPQMNVNFPMLPVPKLAMRN
ncbi:hypothetical protein FRB93_003605 [Tulasnella sp. JGI-2019a]|nr:hypothetical protein FRB93_003605 [Tulasnella sp. JGI-2019a]